MVAIEPSQLNCGSEDAPHFVVDRRLAHLARSNRRQQPSAVHEFPRWHLQIQTAIRRSDTVVGRIPVRHHDSSETPLLLGHIGVEVGVLRHVQTVGEVVRIHNSAHVRFLHGGLKRRHVDFAHRALIDDGIHIVAVVFLVVTEVVLGGCTHALALHALDIGDSSACSQKGIFSEVLKIPAAQRSPINIEARAQHEVHTAGAGVLSNDRSDSLREFGVPCGREADSAKHCRRPVVPDSHWPVGHLQTWQPNALVGADVELVNAADEIDLFFQLQLLEQRIDLRLGRCRGHRRRLRHGGHNE